MWRASRIGNVPHPYRFTAGLASTLAALAIAPSEAYTPVPTAHQVSHENAKRTVPATVTSQTQPETEAFPQALNPPAWDGIQGIEITDEKGIYRALVPPNTDLIKVNLPAEIEAMQQKTTFVAIRWAGYQAISFCGFVSNWEVQDKYSKQYLPDEPGDPCDVDKLVEISRFRSFGQKINGRGKIDGVQDPLLDSADCDPTFYRNYLPPKDSVVGTPENQRYEFQDPVILGNNTKVQMINSIFYRYLSNDFKANFLRLDPANITGATVDEINSMSLWGTGDSDCAKPAKGGPDKAPDAVRGHNPHTAG